MIRSGLIYHLPLTFFGLQPSNKPQIHNEIFELVYYGQGFTHSDVYDMPVYLRNFYTQKLIETRKEEKAEIEKANKKNPKGATITLDNWDKLPSTVRWGVSQAILGGGTNFREVDDGSA